jgi:RNA polymerase sigma-70 factor (ECF subfamily)
MSNLSSPDSVTLAQRGSVDAIGALYDQHYDSIFRYLGARLGDQQMAEDLTGDVFKRMLANLSQYRQVTGTPFRAWLFRIAHNVLVDYYRKEGNPPLVALKEADREDVSSDDLAQAVEQKMTLERVHQALAELEPSQREVVALRFLSGLSVQETAVVIGKTEDAVKALQRRGLTALRIAVSPENSQVSP